MTILENCLAHSVRRHKDKVLFIQPSTGERLSFGDFGDTLAKVHVLLEQQQIHCGDVVTLIAANSIDLAVMLYGVMTFGAIAKPLNPQITPAELNKLMLHSGSSIIFADCQIAIPEYRGRYLEIDTYRQVTRKGHLVSGGEQENNPALLIYTSGTTSQPKGVLLSQQNIVHNVRTAIDFLGLDDQHTKICILPLFHTFGFISDLSAMALCGGTTVILDTFDVTKMSSVEAAIHDYPVNSFSAVPLMFDLFLRFGCNLAGKQMKFCVSGAAPLRENTAAEFLETYRFPIIPAYGLTETTCFATISPPSRIKAGSAGIPAAVKVRVARPDGAEAETGEIGELLVSGESVMQQGYFKNEIECFCGEQNQWFKTGDLGHSDQEGYIYITGRKKNMVIRGGEKIYLEDVDACVAQMQSLADNASIRFEEDGEEKIAAFVVPRHGAAITDFEIRNFVEAQLGRLRVPDLIIFRDSIPRTPTNKVKIRELQALVPQTAGPASA
ncbi:MAG TPA: class I adenylate-forming enzyme family protein [Candidatus Angelobacter sp.]